MKMTVSERKLARKVRKAMAEAEDGNPLKDFLDDDEILDALDLLVRLTMEPLPKKK